jgi:3-phosphoshikimate 1-carboxyvinyltransferase
MKYIVRSSGLNGSIAIPSSKSQTLRAILFGALGTGISHISHPLSSPDTQAMITACRLLGARIDVQAGSLSVQGTGGIPHITGSAIDAGNSGIVLRFCSALCALASEPVVLTGDHSIQHQRPMQPLLEGLSQLGVSVESRKGFAPVRIQGPLRSGTAHISGEDSQPVSALLIAGSFAEGPIELCVRNPGEKPWVELTLSWLSRLHVPYGREGFERFYLPGGARYNGFQYTVPGDLSSLAFPLGAALVTGSEISIHNGDLSDAQGDKRLLAILEAMGARFAYNDADHILHIKAGNPLKGIEVDLNDCIDALPLLTVIACFANGKTVISNVAVARTKESNRIRALFTELSKMGATIQETHDGLIITGAPLSAATVHSHNDHRMAMALSVAALGAQGTSCIEGVACISKTYPSFAQDLQQLGAQIESHPMRS